MEFCRIGPLLRVPRIRKVEESSDWSAPHSMAVLHVPGISLSISISNIVIEYRYLYRYRISLSNIVGFGLTFDGRTPCAWNIVIYIDIEYRWVRPHIRWPYSMCLEQNVAGLSLARIIFFSTGICDTVPCRFLLLQFLFITVIISPPYH
jgi:hypothetical protein